MYIESSDVCGRCIFFKPHIYFPYVGYCVVKQNAVSFEVQGFCESFRPSSIDELRTILREKGWLYCVNCRKIIYDENELKEHVEKHFISPDVTLDESIAEEAYIGD
ncbi:MAG: hypothetical protein QXG46_05900 [Ignisphaera sp.]